MAGYVAGGIDVAKRLYSRINLESDRHNLENEYGTAQNEQESQKDEYVQGRTLKRGFRDKQCLLLN